MDSTTGTTPETMTLGDLLAPTGQDAVVAHVTTPSSTVMDRVAELEALVATLTRERDLARERADHADRGLSIMLGWHEAFVQDIRRKAHEWRREEAWCAVYDRAMSDFGVTPLPITRTARVTLSLDVDIVPTRPQRVDASTDFVRQSLSGSAYTYVQDALSGLDVFDHDFETTDVRVEHIGVDYVEDAEHDTEYDPF